MRKILWNFEIQTDHVIPASRSDLVIVNKKKRTGWIADFTLLTDHRIKLKESEKRDKYLDLTRGLKTIEHEGGDDINCNWCTLEQSPGVWFGEWRIGNKRTGKDHPDYSIIKIGPNTEKSPGDSSEKSSTNAYVKKSQKSKIIKIQVNFTSNPKYS